ncbi:hypothetical protein FB451DRAFT_1398222 [Mycena latifolia]|nr:hypothetical protein FB451DRAFT_1398222 [Mycena latifolia]
MSNTFAARFGPAPFSELVSEIQHRFHADGELMYLAAADFYGQSKVKSFSAFDDPQGYSGSPPSVSYLKALFTDNVAAYRIYIERYIASLPLTVGSGDHTFQLLKYMGDLKGEQIFTAAYTVLNEFEEVRGHSLTQTKALGFVADMFDGIQEGLKNSNHPPTQIFYTDSPQLERSFHESMNSSLTKNVEPITAWTDLPPFTLSSEISTAFLSDSMEIEEAANDVLLDAAAPGSQLSLVALAIKTEQRADGPPCLEIIQLRTRNKIIVFEVTALTSRSDILPSLRAILTNPEILKIGHSIRETLQTIADAFSLPEIGKLAKAKNAPVLDLGKYAKLKAVVDDPSLSLHALSGVVLHKSFSLPHNISYPWSLTPSERNNLLFCEIDCQWQAYIALSRLDSLGLSLQDPQAITHGQPVTLIQACKPIAEGSIIGHHPGHFDAIMDDHGRMKRINVSASRSLIVISKVLVPGSIHKLHNQTIEWIFTHGAQAVVSTSQLLTRGDTPPVPSRVISRAFAVPAPPDISHDTPEFTPSIPPSSGTFKFENYTENDAFESDSDSDAENDFDFDFDDEDTEFQATPDIDEMPGIDGGFFHNTFFNDDISEETPENVLMEGVGRTFALLQQADKLPSRVLDDAFHYMDRLLRLLSKKHSAFKAFARDFSEAIFIRDQSDESAVRAVLEKHGVDWEYAKRAKSSTLNRRIRRYIPERTVLLGRLETLFKAYEDIQCSTKKGHGSFFSDEAKEMVHNLLQTARDGYLSDPPGIPLYYLMGKDRDGLNIYRTVRGTNSLEGGFHMVVRRIFGSLRASPELAECILINWILRRNMRVGFHNRTGRKYRGHYAIWTRDEIVELAIAVNTKPSFPLPRVLSTRIATSETIGILPISKSLAENLRITMLPRPHITVNRYRYLQLRQRTLCAVVPVHTHQEYITFKAHINHPKFRKGSKVYPPHEHWKNIDFLKFAQFWNELVVAQSRTVTDSNLRIYCKLPQQLEAHHKKTILWKSERSTLATGSNFTARKPLLDLLNSADNYVDTLPAIPLPDAAPDGELDFSIEVYNDPTSFNPMAEMPAEGEGGDSEFLQWDHGDESGDDPASQDPIESAVVPQSQPMQSAPPFAPQPGLFAPLIRPVQQALLPGASAPGRTNSKPKASPRRCALCVNVLCYKRATCKGKGGQHWCTCGHPPMKKGQKARATEANIAARLEREAQARA